MTGPTSADTTVLTYDEVVKAVDTREQTVPQEPGRTLGARPAIGRGWTPRWISEWDSASAIQKLRLWLGDFADYTGRTAVEQLERDLVDLDSLIARQLEAVLHNPRFQQLESSWRGLEYLVSQLPIPESEEERANPPVRVEVYCARWDELSRDFERSTEFDQSSLFRQVYSQAFGMAGGDPYGLLIGDYQIEPFANTSGSPLNRDIVDDREVLAQIGQVAAASFCPFIAGLSPAFLGVDAFSDLQHSVDVSQTFSANNPRMVKWRSFRESEDSRFVGLAMPKVLLRDAYDRCEIPVAGKGRTISVKFQEETRRPDLKSLLWGNAAWAYGEIVIRSFLDGRWFGELTGVEPGRLARGLVVGLVETSFRSDRRGLQPKPGTDLQVSLGFGEALAMQGIVPLCQCPGTAYSAFYAAPSLQDPKTYDREDATANAALSSTLDSMLCASRFAHYLKIIAREHLGRAQSAEDLELELHNWVHGYVVSNVRPDAGPEFRAQYPLTEASVEVRPHPGKMGAFLCRLLLRPHFSLDRVVASIKLTTEFAGPDASII